MIFLNRTFLWKKENLKRNSWNNEISNMIMKFHASIVLREICFPLAEPISSHKFYYKAQVKMNPIHTTRLKVLSYLSNWTSCLHCIAHIFQKKLIYCALNRCPCPTTFTVCYHWLILIFSTKNCRGKFNKWEQWTISAVP